MRELYLINKHNQTLDLLNNRHKFILTKAEALHGIDTDIAETESPYTDGSDVDNVRALPRGIELTFRLMGNVKQALDYLTSYIKSKQYVTLREIEDGRDITIKGIATVQPYTRMARGCEVAVSIYCNRPYWEDAVLMAGVIDDIISMLCFPKEGQYFTQIGRPFGVVDTSLSKDLYNSGDTSVGAIFSIVCTGEVFRPQITCNTGEQNGWYMRLNLELKENDEVVISTVKNDKYITINGSEYYDGVPILSYFDVQGNDWLQLEQGSNVFDITATEGQENIYFNATYRRQYE